MTKNYNQLLDINLILNKLSLRAGLKVADLGCGKFEYFIKPIAEIVGDKGMVYGVDIIKETVTDVKKTAWENNLKQVKAIWGDLEVFKGIKINSSSLDRAILINVLNQSTKKIDIIREANRMLKSNGLFLIIDWKLTASPLGPDPHRRVNPEIIKKEVLKLGLELIDEFSPGPFHYALLFNKL